jgi:hypothetical protein
VNIAGVVFNGLTEDISNWSSYGYDEALSPSWQLPGAPVASGGMMVAHRA